MCKIEKELALNPESATEARSFDLNDTLKLDLAFDHQEILAKYKDTI